MKFKYEILARDISTGSKLLFLLSLIKESRFKHFSIRFSLNTFFHSNSPFTQSSRLLFIIIKHQIFSQHDESTNILTNADDLDKIDRRKNDVVQIYSIRAWDIPATFHLLYTMLSHHTPCSITYSSPSFHIVKKEKQQKFDMIRPELMSGAGACVYYRA